MNQRQKIWELAVTDSKGLDIDYTTPPEEDEERQQTATITVLATPEQAMLLTRYENEGLLHVALINRGNAELAEELLARQDEILTTLYGDGTETDEELPEASIINQNAYEAGISETDTALDTSDTEEPETTQPTENE